jgi:hypothetical protein
LPAVTARDRVANKVYVLAEKCASAMMASFAAPRRTLPGEGASLAFIRHQANIARIPFSSWIEKEMCL